MRNDFGVKPGNTRFPYNGGMQKGGYVTQKKQGYKDRHDESIDMRIRNKQTK